MIVCIVCDAPFVLLRQIIKFFRHVVRLPHASLNVIGAEKTTYGRRTIIHEP